MAQGSIIWRCKQCGNLTNRKCRCPRAKYHIRYPFEGSQKWEAVSRSKRDAEKRLGERMAAINSGTYREIKKETFDSFARRWLADYAAGRVKASTLTSYTGLIEKHIIPLIGQKLLTRIYPEDIQALIAERSKEKEIELPDGKKKKTKLSPRTVNYMVIVLKAIFKRAYQWKLIQENPAEHTEKLREEHQEMDYLKPQEIQLLLKHSEEPYKTLFLVAVLTGMRRGELLGLQWGDVDWNNNQILIRRSLDIKAGEDESGNYWRFSSPKTRGSIRTVVMSPKLREALQIHRINGAVNPHDLVFCTKKGTPIDPDNLIKQQFHPALDRAEIRRIRFHDLRHTYTALLIAQGAHAKFIQSQLGHSSIQTTMDLYGHLLPQTHHGVGEKLDHCLFHKEEVPTETAQASAN